MPTPACLGRAFGLDIRSAIPIRGLLPPAGRGRSVQVLAAGPDRVPWASAESRILAAPSLENPNGLTVEHHPALGFRISAAGLGRHTVSADGTRITCRGDTEPAQQSAERVTLAQLVPLAAVLQGLEVFHASATAVGGRLVALTGPQGAGKSTLALHLALLGGTFFTDDVLTYDSAAEPAPFHPGPHVTNVHDPALLELARCAREPFGAALEHGPSSVRVLVSGDERPRALAGFYLLDRRGDADSVTFTPVSEPYPLIASTFNFAVRSRERMERQMDACVAISRSAGVFRLTAPGDLAPQALAAELIDHVDRLGR